MVCEAVSAAWARLSRSASVSRSLRRYFADSAFAFLSTLLSFSTSLSGSCASRSFWDWKLLTGLAVDCRRYAPLLLDCCPSHCLMSGYRSCQFLSFISDIWSSRSSILLSILKFFLHSCSQCLECRRSSRYFAFHRAALSPSISLGVGHVFLWLLLVSWILICKLHSGDLLVG